MEQGLRHCNLKKEQKTALYIQAVYVPLSLDIDLVGAIIAPFTEIYVLVLCKEDGKNKESLEKKITKYDLKTSKLNIHWAHTC